MSKVFTLMLFPKVNEMGKNGPRPGTSARLARQERARERENKRERLRRMFGPAWEESRQ